MFAIFKGRPILAYWIFASAILAFIGIKLVTAETREERSLLILAFIFVAIVLLGQLVRIIRARSVQDSPYNYFQTKSIIDKTILA